MAKTKISEFNANPALNTDIDSINIAEGCAPSGINDAIRELMSQLKDWQAGTSNDPMVIGSSGSLTLNQGTANGVAYLNGSKVVTSGSALTFDGTNLGVGGAASQKLHVQSAGTLIGLLQNTASSADARYRIQNTAGSSDWGVDGTGTYFQDNNSRPFLWFTAGSEQMRLTSTGLGIGTSSPSTPLTIAKTGVDAGLGIFNIARIRDGSSNKGVSIGYLAGSNTTVFTSETTGAASAFGWETYSGSAWAQNMTLDGSGNLGLGVTPSAWDGSFKALQVSNTSLFSQDSTGAGWWSKNARNVGGTWYYIGTGSASYIEQGAGAFKWNTAASGTAGNAITFTQAMTLDASGNLLVGQTSSTDSSFRLQLTGAGGSIHAAMGTNSNAFRFSNVNTSGVEWAVGTSSPGVANAGNFLSFTQFSGGSWAERARIDSSGNLLVGTTATSAYLDGRINTVASGTQPAICAKLDPANTNPVQFVYSSWAPFATGNNIFHQFETETTATIRGSISYNRAGGLVAYNTTSDYRAKDINGLLTDSGSVIDSVPVYMGKMKGATQERPMFIAHETPSYAHTGEKDAVDEDGNPVYQQMDASALIPVMWAEIQSLRARVAQLESN